MMTAIEKHLRELLSEASHALDAACGLLDRKFKTTKWRNDWMIGDTADKIRSDATGYTSFDDAEAEAEKRKSVAGTPWMATFDETGTPIVTILD